MELFWCRFKRIFVRLEKAVNHCCEINCQGLTIKERVKKPRGTRGGKGGWIITPQDKKLFMERKNGNGKNGKKNEKKNGNLVVPFPLKVNSRNHLFSHG